SRRHRGGRPQSDRRPGLGRWARRRVGHGWQGRVMAADLALAADPGAIERSADPAAFVVQACERAKAWLTEALEHDEIEQIAEVKSQAQAEGVYHRPKTDR